MKTISLLTGWTKLSVQLFLLSASMICLSFLTETQVWVDYFNYGCVTISNECSSHLHGAEKHVVHRHWNYRGYVYIFTGIIFFIVSVIRIIATQRLVEFKKRTNSQQELWLKEGWIASIDNCYSESRYSGDQPKHRLSFEEWYNRSHTPDKSK
jgi:low temperature requirement protein LtrA